MTAVPVLVVHAPVRRVAGVVRVTVAGMHMVYAPIRVCTCVPT